MNLELVTDSQIEPVSLEQAKLHCHVDHDDDDDTLDGLITASRQACEELTNRVFIKQVWRLTLDEFPASGCYGYSLERALMRQSSAEIQIRKAKLLAVDHIKYLDDANVQRTLDPLDYQVDTRSLYGRIRPSYTKSWPSTYPVMNAVEAQLQLGYGETPDAVPQAIKQAILLTVGTYYRFREQIIQGLDTKDIPTPLSTKLILSPYKALLV